MRLNLFLNEPENLKMPFFARRTDNSLQNLRETTYVHLPKHQTFFVHGTVRYHVPTSWQSLFKLGNLRRPVCV
jgi:hypothetical protein